MQEAGFAGYDMSQWQGVLAPAGTPRALIGALNAHIAKAMHAPDVHERIAVQGGNDIVTGTPEEFAALIRADLERYARLIREAKISAQ
jgi:tripartite-type tricarboxylate transporter receptor subunit TctC